MKIAIVANTSWYVLNFRTPLIKKILKAGHEVLVVSPRDSSEYKFSSLGASYEQWNLDSSNLNIFSEIKSFFNLFSILRANKIDLILSFTPKANIYSSLSARILKIQYMPNISGLGGGFVNRNRFITSFFMRLYAIALKKAEIVLFQNNEDMDFFKKNSITNGLSFRLPGSGVDLERFKSKATPSNCNSFLLVARLIWSKGIGEYVDAARQIKSNFPNIEFNVLGFLDSSHPDGISKEIIQAWHSEGVISYLGDTDDVKPYLQNADCVVLPSYYREGVPRTLLEAASMATPIITTNHQGCRDALDDMKSGFLCEARNVDDLKEKLIKMINMSSEQLYEFGKAGRKKMEKEFDENLVLNKYMHLIENTSLSK